MRISMDKADPGYYERIGEDPSKIACYVDGERVSAATADEEQGYVLEIVGWDSGARQPITRRREGRVVLERARP